MRWSVATALFLSLFLLGAGVPDFGFEDQMVGLSNDLSNRAHSDVDTFKLLVQHSTLPNTSAADSNFIHAESWYDEVVEAADGSAMMYGYFDFRDSTNVIDDANYVRLRGGSAEDNGLPNEDNGYYYAPLWFDLGNLENGWKIEEAYLCWNNGPFAKNTLEVGDYYYCRLDTVISMYGITDASQGGDACQFDASFQHMNDAAETVWPQNLNTRDDRHDFGPRCAGIAGDGVEYAAGSAWRFDVTEPLQQHLDNGDVEHGALFWLYASSGEGTSTIGAGNNSTNITGAGGNPCLHVVATSRRGPKPWGGTPVPVCLTLDDNQWIQTQFVDELSAAGVKLHSVTARKTLSEELADWDSFNTTNLSDLYYIHHSYSHGSLGDSLTSALDKEFERDWWADGSLLTTAPDTSQIVHFAWPAGGGTYDYAFEPIRKMITYGYKTARAYSSTEDAKLSYPTWMSWDNPVCLYNIAVINSNAVFDTTGADSATIYANMLEEITDEIDKHYTDYSRAAMLPFGHGDTGRGGSLTEESVGIFVDIVGSLNSARLVDWTWLYGARFNGFVAPGEISGYSAAIDSAAARFDAVYNLDTTYWDNLQKTWIGPK